jgi:hypothetical protein
MAAPITLGLFVFAFLIQSQKLPPKSFSEAWPVAKALYTGTGHSGQALLLILIFCSSNVLAENRLHRRNPCKPLPDHFVGATSLAQQDVETANTSAQTRGSHFKTTIVCTPSGFGRSMLGLAF